MVPGLGDDARKEEFVDVDHMRAPVPILPTTLEIWGRDPAGGVRSTFVSRKAIGRLQYLSHYGQDRQGGGFPGAMV